MIEKSLLKRKIKKNGVALALGGGSVRGYFHIGVLKALEEARIPISFISGISIGSLIGGLYASGYDSDRILSILDNQTHLKNLLSILSPVFFNKKGILNSKGLVKELNFLVDNRKIEDFSIPFVCRAVDLNAFKEIIFDKGNFGTAITSSCSIPGVFIPLKNNKNSLIVDGGVFGSVPLEICHNYRPDLPVISSNLIHYADIKAEEARQLTGAFTNNFLHKVIPLADVALRSYFLMQSQLSILEKKLYPPAIEVIFDSPYYPSITNILEVKERLIQDGYDSCKRELEQLNFI